MRFRNTLLPLLLAGSLCSCQSPSTPISTEEVGRMIIQKFDEFRIHDLERIQNVCLFYRRQHGHWPHSANDLAQTPACDGSLFDPTSYRFQEFSVDPATDTLTVKFTGAGAVNGAAIIKPPTSRPATRPANENTAR